MKLAHKKQTNIHTRIKLVTTYFFTSWHPGTKLGVRKTETLPGKRFVYTPIFVPLNTPTCTKSIYLLPFYLFRGPSISFSRDQNMNFFVCLTWNVASKKCVGCIAGVFIEMSALIVNMEKVWLFGGVGAWDHAQRWGKKAKNGIQIGKISASKARSRLPLGLLRSPIFFFFPPMKSLVPGYYETGTNHT